MYVNKIMHAIIDTKFKIMVTYPNSMLEERAKEKKKFIRVSKFITALLPKTGSDKNTEH